MRRWSWLFLAFFAAGCLDVAKCGDLLCPAGFVCSPLGDLCVDPRAIAACEGEEAFAPCSYGGSVGGHCVDDYCEIAVCGNDIQEYGEACDDANEIEGDGCSLECQSDETCGNEIVDVVKGEECDVGIDVAHDGCDACAPTIPFWRQELEVSSRGQTAVAHHAGLAQTVLFGGERDSARLNETLEWDGRNWIRLAPKVSPSPRRNHAMAYDAARERVILFGGNVSNESVNDETWAWDGVDWALLDTNPPPSRAEAAMAYDSNRQVIVLFGGRRNPTLPLDDTWEWDGTDWVERSPATIPPARGLAAMAFDPVRKKTSMCSGDVGQPIMDDFFDCWEWDGTDWTPMAGTAPRLDHVSMTFDPAAGHLILFGQDPDDATKWLSYSFDGSEWNEHLSITTTSEFTIDSAEIFFDTGSQEALVQTDNLAMVDGIGVTQRMATLASSTMNGWFVVGDRAQPGASSYEMAYDPLRGKVLSVGADAIFRWSSSWTQIKDGASSPGPRTGTALAWDSGAGGLVLFGGGDALDDTWTWDGVAWRELTPDHSPPPRGFHAMASDRSRNNVVLFGGLQVGVTQSAYGDTWIWDGSDWGEVEGPGPGARTHTALAYDDRSGEVVLFGGKTALGQVLGDMWLWNGSEWRQWEPDESEGGVAKPQGRASAALVYDPNRRRLILHGGINRYGVRLGDTWEWNGREGVWTPIGLEEQAPAVSQHGAAYDALSAQLLSLGGRDLGGEATGQFSLHSYGERKGVDRCDLALDVDGDGLAGCADALDCWAYCTPLCWPGSTPSWPDDCDTSKPHCGDGVCNPALENARNCPQDPCEPQVACGDFVCDSPEDASSCPGDCPPP